MVVAFLLKAGRRMAISVWVGRPDGFLLWDLRRRSLEQGIYVDRGLMSDHDAPTGVQTGSTRYGRQPLRTASPVPIRAAQRRRVGFHPPRRLSH